MQYSPINPDFPHILHGGDYNPEQWIDYPGIWDQDQRLMGLAHINVASIGIFAWASLEPEEGRFTFDWLDKVLDKMAENGRKVVLATPSGAKPNWMALKYPEIRRVNQQGIRDNQEGRHNHCLTSPVYREKVLEINSRLAERYKDHPALILWHLSNEYGGHCYCPLCFKAFRAWLEERYETVDVMNHKFWSKFWSHTFTSFDQVTTIDVTVHGLHLSWSRFMTDQLISFIRNEAAPLRKFTPNTPITTNFMGTYDAYDYVKIAKELDVVSWDSYPSWHIHNNDPKVAMENAFTHDINRSMKGGQPWILMESTPSQTNWQELAPLKRPGVHLAASLQAVAHGSDSVMYFQFRKSRGSAEKFHGAVVDHEGSEKPRVFREVAETGAVLEKLDDLVGAAKPAEAAVIYDWEVNWALKNEFGPCNSKKEYFPTVASFYEPFWKRGISVDVIDSTADFSGYKLLVAPILYLLRPGVAENIEKFVENGGTFVTTYFSGLVDEDDLCFLGGFPGPLRKVLGIWVEETDVITDGLSQSIAPAEGSALPLPKSAKVHEYADIVHLEGAQALAVYSEQFYAGSPALTKNSFGKGAAYYLAGRAEEEFNDALIGGLIEQLGVKKPLNAEIPSGISVQSRITDETEYVFVLNFNNASATLSLEGEGFANAITGEAAGAALSLPAFGSAVLKRPLGK